MTTVKPETQYTISIERCVSGKATYRIQETKEKSFKEYFFNERDFKMALDIIKDMGSK